MISKIKDLLIFSKNKKLAGVIVLFIIIASLPLTVIISQKQQELRQRAQTPNDQLNLCSTIDYIPICESNSEGSPCEAENDICKIGNIVYRCQL